MKKIGKLSKYIYLLPAFGLTFVIMMLPAVYTLFLSFREWDLLMPAKWVGIANYVQIFKEPTLIRAIFNSFAWVLGSIIFGGCLALFLAILVNSCNRKMRGIYTLIFVAPLTLAPTVVSKIWLRIFETTPGALNSILRGMGLEHLTRTWLNITKPLIPGLMVPVVTIILIFVFVWRLLGLNFILFLVGLQSIPGFYREAAKLDGANELQIFYHITLPLLRPVTLIVIANTIINSWRMFAVPWVMVQGGPAKSTETLAITMYRKSFALFRTGEGAAIAVFIAITSALLSLRWLRGFSA